MNQKKVIRKRHSNREYSPKLCAKPDCGLEFIPTDARQIYCSKQHQIDSNNDKRKIVDSIEKDFTKAAKNNKRILIKIYNSSLYLSRGSIGYSVLQYEGYSFETFHFSRKENQTGEEMYFCFDYGLTLINYEKQLYRIIKI